MEKERLMSDQTFHGCQKNMSLWCVAHAFAVPEASDAGDTHTKTLKIFIQITFDGATS